MPQTEAIEQDGLNIILYRSKMDDKLVIDVDDSLLPSRDRHAGGVPNLRIQVGDLWWELDENGSWNGGT